jgi:hypothetical protein
VFFGLVPVRSKKDILSDFSVLQTRYISKPVVDRCRYDFVEEYQINAYSDKPPPELNVIQIICCTVLNSRTKNYGKFKFGEKNN